MVLASANGLAIALEFAELPPFTDALLRAGALGINRETWRVTMMPQRAPPDPWWVDVESDGHYEIEAVSELVAGSLAGGVSKTGQILSPGERQTKGLAGWFWVCLNLQF